MVSTKASLTKQKHELLRMGEISLWLDTYDDIFSDFDPRPFAERAMSQDFLEEAKRAIRDKPSGDILLSFLMPKKMRDVSQENIIRKRLFEHFVNHNFSLKAEKRKIVMKGLLFGIAGLILMFITTAILYETIQKGYLITFLIVLLEPAGWFLFWDGLELAIFEAQKMNKDLDFYKKMENCEIRFASF